MIPMIMYCGSIFTMLVLYYFYHPSSDASHQTPHTVAQTGGDNDSASSSQSSPVKRAKVIEVGDIYHQVNMAAVEHASSPAELRRRFKLDNRNSAVFSCGSGSNGDGSLLTYDTSSLSPSFKSSVEMTMDALSCGGSQRLMPMMGAQTMAGRFASLAGPMCKYLGLSEYWPSRMADRDLSLNDLISDVRSRKNIIEDNFKTLDELLHELNRLEIFSCQTFVDAIAPSSLFNFETTSLLNQNSNAYSCNVIIGVDFTASNEWKGRKTFSQQSLHKTLGNKLHNPYQRVISILGSTINKLISSSMMSMNNKTSHNDNTIGLKIYPYGFGDLTTKDKNVFSFFDQTNNHHCIQVDQNFEDNYFETFEEVLNRYNEVVKRVNLSGPSTFAPLIYRAIDIVRSKQQMIPVKPNNQSSNENVPVPKYPFHILFIIADGKVTSENERETVEAIVEASEYPLSIVMIGVGDGPFDTMVKFDNRICAHSKFDNFQFVDFHQTVKQSKTPEAIFGLKALMEIPEQFRSMKKLNLV